MYENLPRDFEAQLEDTYVREGLRSPYDHWPGEGARALRAADLMAGVLHPHYTFETPIGAGGGGIVVRIRDNQLEVIRALKFARPVLRDAQDANARLAAEARMIARVAHQHVIPIYAVDSVTDATNDGSNPHTYHYYIMEFVEGKRNALEYLALEPDEDRVAEIIGAMASALHVLHERAGIMHSDVKPENIFCGESGRVLLADFGFAKRLGDSGLTTNVGGTAPFMHPDLQEYIEAQSSSKVDKGENRSLRVYEYPRSNIVPVWDVYSLGVTLLWLLSYLDFAAPTGTANYKRRYLRLLGLRMLDGEIEFARQKNRGEEARSGETKAPIRIPGTILGLPQDFLNDETVPTMADVSEAIGKLTGALNLTERVPELRRHQVDIIQAASHGAVAFSERVGRLMDAQEVRSLGNLKQLNLVNLVYPTATHSRLEHTLGTFAMVCRVIRALYSDTENPLFRQIMTERDLTLGLVVALVHDTGHYPLAHDLEEADETVFSHETRTEQLLKTESSEMVSVMAACWGITAAEVISVLKVAHGKELGSVRHQLLAALLSGPIDADKLDYLIRDSENLRLP